jgi:site-specific DNA recombinase
MTSNKPLRFAALVRVSTERQEKKGESLRTQTRQTLQAVESLGGEIVATYAGQEHGTAGWERLQLDRLLTDAQKPRRLFDAVVVADPSRWSRDNVASETGLDTLRNAGVRFFVLTSEYDLFDPQARLFLGLSSTIGAFQARVQRQKSMLNRIERARRGLPTVGLHPYGRVWDRDAKAWTVDEEARAKIAGAARRYLAGEPVYKLALEIGLHEASLYRILRGELGTDWRLHFKAKDLNIDEWVTLAVPELVDEKTRQRLAERLADRRTFLHPAPRPVNNYLLSGRVFCGGCGYALVGEVCKGRRYYTHPARRVRACPVKPRPWVSADTLEGEVVGKLVELFGNPSLLAPAVRAAVPDPGEALDRRRWLEAELDKVSKRQDKVLNLIARDLIPDDKAEAELLDYKGKADRLHEELDALDASLENIPTDEQIDYYWQQEDGSVLVYGDDGEAWAANDVGALLSMSAEDKRRLVGAVFGRHLTDGKPAGVYVTPKGQARKFKPRAWEFTIRGTVQFEAALSGMSSLGRTSGTPPAGSGGR